MKNKLLFLFFLSFFYCNILLSQNISELRSIFQKSSSDEKSSVQFYAYFDKNEMLNPTLLGYKGASIIIKSKYESIPKNKIELYKEGEKILESSIKNDSLNAELHMIRFVIQENSPQIMKYNQNLISDKEFLLKTYKKLKDKTLETEIYVILCQSKITTELEKKLLSCKDK